MKITKWFSRKEQELRASLKDSGWWKTTFAGVSETASGMSVSPDSALHQPAVFACVRVISEDTASIPIKVYSKKSEMERDTISGHPVSKLFQKTPNPEMTPFTFKETMTAHVLLYGNAYAEIERDNSGTPIALWILLPERIQVKIADGRVVYEYQTGSKTIVLESGNVFHLKGLGHDGILGYSPIAYARETIGISAAMERSGAKFFSNSCRLSGILSHPAKLSEDASKRLREGWRSMFSGNENVGGTAILEEGMKWEQLSVPHSDAQWLEARQYALQDVARIYRVPPHLIGDLSRSSFSNIESQQIAYMQQTLMPWLRRWEQEINRKLIATNDNSVYAEFLAEEVLRGNTSERYDAYKSARETGWMSVNEIRKRENLNAVEGGDIYIQPLNFTGVNETEQEEVKTQDSRGDAWLEDSIGRAVAIIRNASNRKAKKLNDREWADWLEVDDKQLTLKVCEILQPACRSIGRDEKEVAVGLIDSWRSTVIESQTIEQRTELCCDWSTKILE